MIRSLGRLSACIEDKARLAAALGVSERGYLLAGRAEQEARRRLTLLGVEVPPGAVFDESAKLVRIASQRRSSPEGRVEHVLRAYKLGLEVVAEEASGQLKGASELRLQRHLLKFLVEREIEAFGTKFGYSEADVRAHDHLGALIVETKVVREQLPSQATLNKWLGQVGSYMSQSQQVALRGALVIYNFSTSPIVVPVLAIHGYYLIVAINLSTAPPSKRKPGIHILAGAEGELIQVGWEAAPKRTRRKRR